MIAARPRAIKQIEDARVYLFSERVRRDVQVVLLDQVGWYLSKGTWALTSITLLHLPPYSPALNPAKRLWAFLQSHYPGNRDYGDYDDLLSTCGNAWDQLTAGESVRSVAYRGYRLRVCCSPYGKSTFASTSRRTDSHRGRETSLRFSLPQGIR
jgi:hypothetical protein